LDKEFFMDSQTKTILLTGAPGIGKTTVMRKVAKHLSGRSIRGFVTDEIRAGDRRVGFRLESFDGQSVVLAHVDLRSARRVGIYRVDVAALDRAVSMGLLLGSDESIFLVDEIGKMECCSKLFVSAIEKLLDSGRLVLATVALAGNGFIERVKEFPDVELWPVTEKNRDGMVERVVNCLRLV
jgi:nucleoside-triphosphatase